jgi:hypothetical protein
MRHPPLAEPQALAFCVLEMNPEKVSGTENGLPVTRHLADASPRFTQYARTMSASGSSARCRAATVARPVGVRTTTRTSHLLLRDRLANPVDRRILEPAIGGCGRATRAPGKLVRKFHCE